MGKRTPSTTLAESPGSKGNLDQSSEWYEAAQHIYHDLGDQRAESAALHNLGSGRSGPGKIVSVIPAVIPPPAMQQHRAVSAGRRSPPEQRERYASTRHRRPWVDF